MINNTRLGRWFVFGWLELIDALFSILTLAYWSPKLSTKFLYWDVMRYREKMKK